MDMFKEELSTELNKIKLKIDTSSALDQEDIKAILISTLSEEDFNESKQ